MIVLIVVNDTLGNPLIHHSFLFRKRQKGRSPDQLTDLAAKLQVDPFDGDRGIQELAPQTTLGASPGHLILVAKEEELGMIVPQGPIRAGGVSHKGPVVLNGKLKLPVVILPEETFLHLIIDGLALGPQPVPIVMTSFIFLSPFLYPLRF